MAQPAALPGHTTLNRNSFLDAVRAIAILRVLAWHTYGFAWLSYLVASMPAMFFVAGSLMAHSLGRGQAGTVLFRRFRRLLIPTWVLALFALTVMLAYEARSDAPGTDLREWQLVWWVFPAWDPTGSEWGIVWWASLWYLRCLAWLMVASPILLWLWRRSGFALLSIPLAVLVLGEARLRAGDPLPWQIDDASLYTCFWLLGFAYHDGRFAFLDRAWRLVLAFAAAAAAAAWALSQDVPGGVVNASYPLHLAVGLAWLFGALAFEGVIAAAARRDRVADAIYWVNERALTIYLWHTAGLFVMYQVLWTGDRAAWIRHSLAFPIVVAVTFLAVLAFGWIEDVAGGRSPRLWPKRSTAQDTARPGTARSRRLLPGLAAPAALAAAGAVAIALAASAVVREPGNLAQTSAAVIPPSGVGLRLRTEAAVILPEPPTRPAPSQLEPVSDAELQAEFELWLNDWALSGATATILRPGGDGWTGAAGVNPWRGSAFESHELYPVASVTKTFTAALILRFAERGQVNLDEPIAKYVPEFPGADSITPRQLIQHTSGLVATDAVSPADALALAAESGLQFDPGSGFLYSSPGYFLLGLVIEQIEGKPYMQAIRDEFLAPLGLEATFMDDELSPLGYSTHPYGGWSNFDGALWSSGGLHRELVPEFDYQGTLWSSAGIFSTTDDMARWALALWDGGAVVSDSTRDAMTTFLGPEFEYAGLATYPSCPCWWEGDRLRAERWGHLGLTGTLEYDPVDRIAIAVATSGTVVDENVITALDDLSRRLRNLVRGRAMPRLESAQFVQPIGVSEFDPGTSAADEAAPGEPAAGDVPTPSAEPTPTGDPAEPATVTPTGEPTGDRSRTPTQTPDAQPTDPAPAEEPTPAAAA